MAHNSWLNFYIHRHVVQLAMGLGILFLLWVIPDLISGVTYFMEPIEKKEHAILYWVIIVSWILMSMYSIASLFVPALAYYQ